MREEARFSALTVLPLETLHRPMNDIHTQIQHADTTDRRSLDTVFDLLSDGWRRQVLELLADHEQLTVDELVTEIMETADDVPADRETVSIALHHHHLPLLEANGLLHYDTTAKTVERHTKVAVVDRFLTLAQA